MRIFTSNSFTYLAFFVIVLSLSLTLTACGNPTEVGFNITPTIGANILPYSGLATPTSTTVNAVKPVATDTPLPGLPTVTPPVPPTVTAAPVVVATTTVQNSATNTPAPATTSLSPTTSIPTTTNTPLPTNTPEPTNTTTTLPTATTTVPPTATTTVPPSATPVLANTPTNAVSPTIAPTNSQNEWLGVDHDAGRTRSNETEKTISSGNVQNLQLLWQTRINSNYALVWNNQVVTLNNDDKFQNFNIKDGSAGAAYGEQAKFADFGILENGSVFKVEGNGEFLAAYDITSGKQIFRKPHNQAGDTALETSHLSVITQNNGLVLLGTGATTGNGGTEPTNYVLSGQDGSVKWKVKSSVGSEWAVSGKTAVLSNFGLLAGYDLANGKQLWKSDSSLPTVFMAGSSTVFAANTTGNAVGSGPVTVTAYNSQNGQVRWKQNYSGNLSSQLLASDGKKLFVEISDTDKKQNTIYAFDAATGKQIWNMAYPATDNNSHSASALANGLLYVGDGNKVRVIDASSGNNINQITIEQTSPLWLAVAEGHLLLTSSDGNNVTLYVYGLPS